MFLVNLNVSRDEVYRNIEIQANFEKLRPRDSSDNIRPPLTARSHHGQQRSTTVTLKTVKSNISPCSVQLSSCTGV